MNAQNLLKRPLAFLDLETTGANPLIDRITEIGLITVSAEGTVEEWSSLVNPETPIPPFIEKLTGISNDMVADQPTFARLADALKSRLHGHLLIAHNARFDYGFLRLAYQLLDQTFRSDVLCTVKLSRKLFPQFHRHGLDALVERYQLSTTDRHRALADTRLLWQFWQRLPELAGSEQRVHDAIVDILKPPRLPPLLDSALLDQLPETPGAWWALDSKGGIKIAKTAINLRREVLQRLHRDADSRLGKELSEIHWAPALSSFGAEIAHLIRPPRPLLSPPVTWQWTGDTTQPLRLGAAEKTQFDAAHGGYGLFLTEKEARHSLARLADWHRLCLLRLGLERPGKTAKPCQAYTARRCQGVCCGEESIEAHDSRLKLALERIRLPDWPASDELWIRETDPTGLHSEWHGWRNWAYVGTVNQPCEPVLNGALMRLLREKLQSTDPGDIRYSRP